MKTRWLYRVVALLAIAVAVSTTLAWIAVSNVSDQADQIQAERTRNILASCRQQNRQNAAIVGFVTATIPRDRRDAPQAVAYLNRARKTFPQRDCTTFARGQVGDG